MTPSIAELEKNLNDLTKEHQSACEATEAARKNETSVLNRLNSAQRAFDEAIQGLKQASRPETDWGNAARRKP